MEYTLQKLQDDVMARLGESVQPSASCPGVEIPTVGDIIGKKIRSLLPMVGKRLIMEASSGELGGGKVMEATAALRLMPCKLYGAEIALPNDFLRLCSVKMKGWSHGLAAVVMPGEPGWSRQWSKEPGIAGCQERPRAYLVSEGGSVKIRAIGSAAESDSLEWLYGWQVPEVGSDGKFHFPDMLYPELIRDLILKF